MYATKSDGATSVPISGITVACLAQNLANLWYLASAVLVRRDGIHRRTLVEDFTHEDNKCHLLRWPRRLQWDRDGRCWWHSTALSSFWPKHLLGCFDLRSASIAIQASQILDQCL